MNKQKKDRILENCTYIKTFLILAVVIGHCSATWTGNGWFIFSPSKIPFFSMLDQWVGSFHIYCFTLVSGYIYSFLRFEKGKYKNAKDFIKKKTCRLLIPYFVVMLVWAFPFLGLSTEITKNIFVKNYLFAVSPQQLWFLWMLFWVFVIERLVFDRINNRIVKFGFALIIWEFGFLGGLFATNYFQVFNGMQFYLFFLIGMKIRDGSLAFVFKCPSYIFGILHVTMIVLSNVIVFGNSIVGKVVNLHFSLLIHIVGSVE